MPQSRGCWRAVFTNCCGQSRLTGPPMPGITYVVAGRSWSRACWAGLELTRDQDQKTVINPDFLFASFFVFLVHSLKRRPSSLVLRPFMLPAKTKDTAFPVGGDHGYLLRAQPQFLRQQASTPQSTPRSAHHKLIIQQQRKDCATRLGRIDRSSLALQLCHDECHQITEVRIPSDQRRFRLTVCRCRKYPQFAQDEVFGLQDAFRKLDIDDKGYIDEATAIKATQTSERQPYDVVRQALKEVELDSSRRVELDDYFGVSDFLFWRPCVRTSASYVACLEGILF